MRNHDANRNEAAFKRDITTIVEDERNNICFRISMGRGEAWSMRIYISNLDARPLSKQLSRLHNNLHYLHHGALHSQRAPNYPKPNMAIPDIIIKQKNVALTNLLPRKAFRFGFYSMDHCGVVTSHLSTPWSLLRGGVAKLQPVYFLLGRVLFVALRKQHLQ